jgi:hypothetical protein
MTIQEFADITNRVIARDGFGNYLPTAIFPERHHVAVLEGAPIDIDIELASCKWAKERAHGSEEYLVAFKIDRNHYKIIHRIHELFEEAVFEAVNTYYPLKLTAHTARRSLAVR